jgi:hypothetical protein
VPVTPTTYDPRELGLLPPPVQRYFRVVLREGQPLITGARFTHVGTFNMGETEPNWRAFSSSQVVTTRRPGFVWDGRLRMVPGLNAFVHDAYVAGDGLLHATLLGVVTVADIRGTSGWAPELRDGMRIPIDAEGAWLLPAGAYPYWRGRMTAIEYE